MKQKLLNSFTWRASLLVAFLCCAFSSAWAEDYTLTNSNITWTGATSNNQYASSSTTYALSASFPGFIKSVTITGGTNNPNCTASTVVKVDDTQIGSTTNIGNGSSDYTFNGNDKYSENITITFNVTGKNKNHHLSVSSITVTYTPAAKIPINAEFEGNYYGTYSNASPFVCPTAADGFTVSKVSVSNGTLSVESLTGVVPAGTGVLVSSSSSSNDKVKAVKLAKPNGSYNPVSGNMLHPSSEAMTSIEDYSLYYFYHLTFNDSNPLGFYWGKSDGGAWTFSGTNKAYLAVPKTDSGYSAVKGFTLSDSADGIKAIETEKNSEMVFNLAGQRVSKMQKGIYVVNGKKILVK